MSTHEEHKPEQELPPEPTEQADGPERGSRRPSAAERLHVPEALLSRSDFRELGLERRAIDVIFRECPVVALPGYSRPMVRCSDYVALLERSTYDDRAGDRVRP